MENKSFTPAQTEIEAKLKRIFRYYFCVEQIITSDKVVEVFGVLDEKKYLDFLL